MTKKRIFIRVLGKGKSKKGDKSLVQYAQTKQSIGLARSITGKTLPVTSQQAQIISAFEEDGLASVPELAVAVRWKPSQVKQVIDRLLETSPYLRKQTPHFIELTPEGKSLRKRLRVESSR